MTAQMTAQMGPFDVVFPAENIRHHFIGQDQAMGVYAKELHIPAGFELVSHKHLYDHLSILASGTIVLIVNGTVQSRTGPCALEIKAGIVHSVRAITDAVWFCIHPTDETDENKIDETLVEKGGI
jgi:quercetin dioxygenase-like cupin family protein